MKSYFKDTKEDSLGFLLWQTTTIWQREIKTELEKLNLSHSSFVILASLVWFKEQDVKVTQTTIINHTKLDKMTVSKSLKSLVQKKLVLRKENKIDTRSKIITLTKEGFHISIKAIETVEKVDDTFFNKLSLSEKNQIKEIFKILIKG